MFNVLPRSVPTHAIVRVRASQGYLRFLGARGRGGRGNKKVGPGAKAATSLFSFGSFGNRGKL